MHHHLTLTHLLQITITPQNTSPIRTIQNKHHRQIYPIHKQTTTQIKSNRTTHQKPKTIRTTKHPVQHQKLTQRRHSIHEQTILQNHINPQTHH